MGPEGLERLGELMGGHRDYADTALSGLCRATHVIVPEGRHFITMGAVHRDRNH